jgi:hypothetical protein
MGLEVINNSQVFTSPITALQGIVSPGNPYPIWPLTTSFNYWTSSAKTNATVWPINVPQGTVVLSNPASFIVSIGGVLQSPSTYTIDTLNNLITFGTAVPANTAVQFTQLATAALSSAYFVNLSAGYANVNNDLTINGNLVVVGSATYISTKNFVVGDSLLYIASGAVGNSNDIGIVGHFFGGLNNSTNGYQHTGLVRKNSQGSPGFWTFFSGVTTEPLTANNLTGLFSDPTSTVDSLQVYHLSAVSNVYANSVLTYGGGFSSLAAPGAANGFAFYDRNTNVWSQSATLGVIYRQNGVNGLWDSGPQGSSGTNIISYLSSGYVGIGINNNAPSFNLDVATSQGPGVYGTIVRGNGAIVTLPNAGVGNYNSLVQNNDQAIIFYGSGGANTGALTIAPYSNTLGGVRIDSSGNIGIGAVGAGGAYRVDNVSSQTDGTGAYIRAYNSSTGGSSNAGFTAQNNVSGVPVQTQLQVFGTDSILNTVSNHDLAFRTNNNERMRIKNTAGLGYVGINTPSPNKMLTVVGDISATGNIYSSTMSVSAATTDITNTIGTTNIGTLNLLANTTYKVYAIAYSKTANIQPRLSYSGTVATGNLTILNALSTTLGGSPVAGVSQSNNNKAAAYISNATGGLIDFKTTGAAGITFELNGIITTSTAGALSWQIVNYGSIANTVAAGALLHTTALL